MPTPKPGEETREEWMSRCIEQVLEDGAAEDSDQAVAMCSSMWEEATKEAPAKSKSAQKVNINLSGNSGFTADQVRGLVEQINKQVSEGVRIGGSGGDKENKKKALAYAVLNVKQVESDKRLFTGTATTPTPDRVGDIIEPLGVKFKNPLPLLHHHRSDMPVGTVKLNRPTEDGITFEARLPKIEEPGPLKDRVDTAWGEIKAGLVRGVSVGFRELEASMLDSGGIHFIESEILELSLVTIPANAEATIQTIKSFDADALAACGHERKSGNGANGASPGASGKSLKSKRKDFPKMPMTTAERITAFEAKREAKAARMRTLMEEAGDETLGGDEQEEYDTLQGEVKAIDEHLVRLNDLAKSEVKKATPVDGSSPEAAAAARGGELIRVSVKEQKLPPGIRFARVVKCLGLAHKMHRDVESLAAQLYPDDIAVQKAAVAAGTTAGTTWAGPLVGDETGVFADFVEYLRPQTIIGKFGAGGVPSLRRVPFRTPLITQSSGGEGYWVGEGKAKPLTKFDFSRRTIEPLKVANIAVLTMEVIRDSNPSAETIIRDQLAAALIQRMDADFIDPDKGAVSGVSPASITNGLTAVASAGNDADAIRTDIAALVKLWIDANNRPTSGVWIMSAVTALQLGLMMNALGQPEWPGVTMNGGNFFGMPVLTTEHVSYVLDSPGENRYVVLVNASDVYLADEGGVDVAMSTEASLQMDDAPTNASEPVAATSLVSMFQTNSVAFRAERTINWLRRRDEAVALLTNVNWGA